MLQYLVFVGAVVQLIGIYPYVKETVRGDTKPNRVTWLMWSVAPLIGTAAALVKGVGWAVLPVFMSGFAPLIVFAASFVNPKSYWKLERFDYLCGLCSLLALMLWGITNVPEIAIVFAILSDGCAAVPTLIKSWRYPETETITAFSTGIFNSLTSFVAVRTWTFSAYAFPAYLVLINISIVVALKHRNFSFSL